MTVALQKLGKDIKIFHGFKREQMVEIQTYLEEKSFNRGIYVVEEGTDASCMYILLNGEVEIWKASDNNQKAFCLGKLSDGDCFGEMSLVDCQRRSASVLAVSDLSVLVLPYSAMTKIYKTDPKLYAILLMNIAREISRRLRESEQTLLQFALPASA